MRVHFEDHPFWEFSLAVYGTEGVSAACIALQERHGVDVNVLLFCAWLGASGRGTLDPAELAAATEAVGAWNREVVSGLRAVRRWMRDARTGVAPDLADALRRQIINIEVQCEHAEQLALARAVPRTERAMPPPDRVIDDAVGNCLLYLGQLHAVAGADDQADLTTILAAAIPDAARPIVRAVVERRSSGA